MSRRRSELGVSALTDMSLMSEQTRVSHGGVTEQSLLMLEVHCCRKTEGAYDGYSWLSA